MVFKKRQIVKRIVILILIVFSIVISGTVALVYQHGLKMDGQHIRVLTLSSDVENIILKSRISIDDLIFRNDESILLELYNNLDSISESLENLNAIFIDELKIYKNNELDEFNNEYKIIYEKLLAFKDCIFDNSADLKVSEIVLIDAYTSLYQSFHIFRDHVQSYLFKSTILYKREIFVVLFVISLLVLIASYLIILLINQLILADRKLTLKTIEVENRERQRIAADLHDGLGAYLSAMNMHTQVLEKEYEENLTLSEKIKYLNKLTRLSHQSVEEVINNLNPSLLSRLGLIATIEKSILKVNSLDKTQFSFDSSKLITKLCPNTEIILYRICTELINNALKHSEAKKAEFTLFNSKNKIHLNYEDNGIGFMIEESIYESEKTGLYNLSNRVESVDGSFKINSGPDKGVNIKISLNLI